MMSVVFSLYFEQKNPDQGELSGWVCVGLIGVIYIYCILILCVDASVTNFECDLVREKVKAGLDGAKKRGKKVERPDTLNNKLKNGVCYV